MIEIPLTEGSAWSPVHRLTPVQATAALATHDVKSRSAGPGEWRFRTHQQAPKVGAIRLGTGEDAVLFRIAPKMIIPATSRSLIGDREVACSTSAGDLVTLCDGHDVFFMATGGQTGWPAPGAASAGARLLMRTTAALRPTGMHTPIRRRQLLDGQAARVAL